jgi:hypothetical protein
VTTTKYLYAMGTRPQAAARNGGAWEYLLPDALGSVRQIADSSGNVTLAKSYEPRAAVTVLTSTPLGGAQAAGTASSIFAYAGVWLHLPIFDNPIDHEYNSRPLATD